MEDVEELLVSLELNLSVDSKPNVTKSIMMITKF